MVVCGYVTFPIQAVRNLKGIRDADISLSGKGRITVDSSEREHSLHNVCVQS